MTDRSAKAGAASHRSSLARASLALLVGLVAAGLASILIELLGRVRVETAYLLRPSVQTAISLAIGLAFALISWAGLRRPSFWWPLLVGLAVPFVAFEAWIGAPIRFHLEYGTPTVQCERDALDVRTCVGRDWSWMQRRLAFMRMTGDIRAETCRRFVAGVPDTPASAVNEDGWVRCPFDDPSVWSRTDCDPTSTPGRHLCFECGGRSRTNDDYLFIQAFDAGCRAATIIRVVNMSPSNIDACRHSIRETEG